MEMDMVFNYRVNYYAGLLHKFNDIIYEGLYRVKLKINVHVFMYKY